VRSREEKKSVRAGLPVLQQRRLFDLERDKVGLTIPFSSLLRSFFFVFALLLFFLLETL
jgi:hypothetical protein